MVHRRNFVQFKKIQEKCIGPFRVRKKLSYQTDELEDQEGKFAGRWYIKDFKLSPAAS